MAGTGHGVQGEIVWLGDVGICSLCAEILVGRDSTWCSVRVVGAIFAVGLLGE